jgi:hypothetical protein
VTTYKGVLLFHSETGTEGGYWAMQDEKFMGLVDESTMNTYTCSRCGSVWDKTRNPEEPKPSFLYWDDNTAQGHGGYRSYDEPHPEMLDGSPGSLDESWNRQRNSIALECYKNGHAEWELLYPDGTWSYEGLHVLKDGDTLTVYADETRSEVRWSGTVKLTPQPLFTTDVANMWVHSLPDVGMTPDEWGEMFFKELPCTLETT